MNRKLVILLSVLLCAFTTNVKAYSVNSYPYSNGIYTTSSSNIQQSNFYSTSGYLNTPRNSYGYRPGIQQQNNRIGYTTIDYGNRTTVGYTTTGTYNPGQSSSPGPRRITVYDGNGNTRETPGGDSDPEGVYQYDESTRIWYYSPDGGITWYEWRSKGFWEAIGGVLFDGDWSWGTTWRSVNHQQTENATNWASDPDDPFLQPIDSKGMLLFLSIMAIVYCVRKKRNSKVTNDQ